MFLWNIHNLQSISFHATYCESSPIFINISICLNCSYPLANEFIAEVFFHRFFLRINNTHIYIRSKWKTANGRTVMRYPRPARESRAYRDAERENWARSWLARTRTPPKTPFTFVDRDQRARKRGKFRFARSSLSPYRCLSDICDNDIHRLGVKSGDFTTQAPFVTSLSFSSSEPALHRRRRRSEKEVSARESVSLGKKLG